MFVTFLLLFCFRCSYNQAAATLGATLCRCALSRCICFGFYIYKTVMAPQAPYFIYSMYHIIEFYFAKVLYFSLSENNILYLSQKCRKQKAVHSPISSTMSAFQRLTNLIQINTNRFNSENLIYIHTMIILDKYCSLEELLL